MKLPTLTERALVLAGFDALYEDSFIRCAGVIVSDDSTRLRDVIAHSSTAMPHEPTVLAHVVTAFELRALESINTGAFGRALHTRGRYVYVVTSRFDAVDVDAGKKGIIGMRAPSVFLRFAHPSP